MISTVELNWSDVFPQLAGSLGFISSIALSVYLPASRNPAGLIAGLRGMSSRSMLMSTMAGLWAGRLGYFLFNVSASSNLRYIIRPLNSWHRYLYLANPKE